MAFMGLTFVCFGLLDMMNNTTGVIIVALILRFLEGMQCAIQIITNLAVATNEFPENRDMAFSLIITASAFGLIAGPLVGSILYTFLAFKWTFVVYGGIQILLAILIRSCLPERRIHVIDQPESEPEVKNEILLNKIEKSEELLRPSQVQRRSLAIISAGGIRGSIMTIEEASSKAGK